MVFNSILAFVHALVQLALAVSSIFIQVSSTKKCKCSDYLSNQEKVLILKKDMLMKIMRCMGAVYNHLYGSS